MKNTFEAQINISSEWFFLITRNFTFDWEETVLLSPDGYVEIIYRNREKSPDKNRYQNNANHFFLLPTCKCLDDKFLLSWDFLPEILSKQKQNHMASLSKEQKVELRVLLSTSSHLNEKKIGVLI